VSWQPLWRAAAQLLGRIVRCGPTSPHLVMTTQRRDVVGYFQPSITLLIKNNELAAFGLPSELCPSIYPSMRPFCFVCTMQCTCALLAEHTDEPACLNPHKTDEFSMSFPGPSVFFAPVLETSCELEANIREHPMSSCPYSPGQRHLQQSVESLSVAVQNAVSEIGHLSLGHLGLLSAQPPSV